MKNPPHICAIYTNLSAKQPLGKVKGERFQVCYDVIFLRTEAERHPRRADGGKQLAGFIVYWNRQSIYAQP